MVPLVMSATIVIPRTLPKNLKELGLSGGGAITMMQKAVLVGTCATVRRFLNLPSTIQKSNRTYHLCCLQPMYSKKPPGGAIIDFVIFAHYA